MFFDDQTDGAEPTGAYVNQDPDLKEPLSSEDEKLKAAFPISFQVAGSIATRIRVFLKEYGMKEYEFAKHVGVDEKSVNNWLCGRNRITSRNGENVEAFMEEWSKSHPKQTNMLEPVPMPAQPTPSPLLPKVPMAKVEPTRELSAEDVKDLLLSIGYHPKLSADRKVELISKISQIVHG